MCAMSGLSYSLLQVECGRISIYNEIMETLEKFIKTRPHLVWYVHDVRKLSEEAIVESVLNYGDFDDVKKLIALLGMQRVAEIFRKQTNPHRRRSNYNPKISNYFRLFFGKNYA